MCFLQVPRTASFDDNAQAHSLCSPRHVIQKVPSFALLQPSCSRTLWLQRSDLSHQSPVHPRLPLCCATCTVHATKQYPVCFGKAGREAIVVNHGASYQSDLQGMALKKNQARRGCRLTSSNNTSVPFHHKTKLKTPIQDATPADLLCLCVCRCICLEINGTSGECCEQCA